MLGGGLHSLANLVSPSMLSPHFSLGKELI